jgi:hypothetical protein
MFGRQATSSGAEDLDGASWGDAWGGRSSVEKEAKGKVGWDSARTAGFFALSGPQPSHPFFALVADGDFRSLRGRG